MIDTLLANEYFKKYIKDIEHRIQKVCESDQYIERVLSKSLFGGKKVRPLILILMINLLKGQSKEEEGKSIPEDDLMNCALAIELIHTASLIHDDVIDGNTLRRNRKTVNATWDNRKTILSGDYLFAGAFVAISNVRNPEISHITAKATSTLAKGEMCQLFVSNDISLTVDLYFEVIKSKTSALFELACNIAAVLSNSSSEITTLSIKLGEIIGILFQILDDLLDYFSSSISTGKGLFTDYKEGKITLPVIYALNSSESNKSKMIELFSKNDKSDMDAKSVQEIIQNSGSREKCKDLIAKYCLEAKEIITNLSTVANSKGSEVKIFLNMIDFLSNRRF